MQTEAERAPRNEQPPATEAERIAEVLGPTLMALTASEALNYHIWDTQFPAVNCLNGLFLFVGGVSILRREHRWTRHWPVLVTILGWIATLGGLARLFAPEAPQPRESAGMYAFLTAGFAVGGFLTYKGYGASEQSSELNIGSIYRSHVVLGSGPGLAIKHSFLQARVCSMHGRRRSVRREGLTCHKLRTTASRSATT